MGQSGLAGTTGRDLSGKRYPGYPVPSDDFLVSFDFETNEDFFLLTKQSDSRFVCDYENGEKIVVSLKYL